ncbi:helix-turn-helix domain-containing protein [Achromobacter xylosoxidans]
MPGRATIGSWRRCCAPCMCWRARQAWSNTTCCRRTSVAHPHSRPRRRWPACRRWPTTRSARRWPRTGDVSAAARALGVHRSTLYRRAAALGLARPR